MGVVINFVGGPGKGKSTLSALLFAEMKINHLNVEHCREVIKEYIWLEDEKSFTNQEKTCKEQLNLIKNIKNKVDYLVCDGSLVQCMYYNKHFCPNNKDSIKKKNKIEKLLLSELEDCDNVFIFLQDNDFPFSQLGRIHTEEESNVINVELEWLLRDEGFPYRKFKSSKDSVIPIMNYIQERMLVINDN